MTTLTTLAFFALGLVAVLLILVLFEPPLRYEVKAPKAPLDSDDFLRLVGALGDAPLHRTRGVEVYCDGKEFYEAELAAIATAQVCVHVEAFIFHDTRIGRRFLTALTERAAAGVRVKVVVDWVGSFPTRDRFFDPLRAAGGRVAWYQPLRLMTLKRLNNRTHREIITIDGKTAFIGGAGISAHWDEPQGSRPPWRDMMFKVDAGLAAGLQSAFAENWLEASGEVLAEVRDFPPIDTSGERPTAGYVVISSPTAGRSTRARLLFQLMIASAKQSICIHSPYFLPDRSAAAELVCAAKERGVKVQVIVPGKYNNHGSTRLASRRRYGQLLEAGVEIYEYQPGMIHTKTMTIDGLWVLVGSTNFDSRSFDLNDEINLVAADRGLAGRVDAQCRADLGRSTQITYEAWRKRSMVERVLAQVCRVVERQE